jgi:outer membrane scaffolding protein for murein synthesis (MipA/OmpV family)
MAMRGPVLACVTFLLLATTVASGPACAEDASVPILLPYERTRLSAELPTDGLVLDVGVGASMRPKRVGQKSLIVDPVPLLEVQWGTDIHLSLADGLTFTPVYVGPVAFGAVLALKQTNANPRLTRGLRSADRSEAGGLIHYFSPVGDFELQYRQGLDGDSTDAADLTYDVGADVSSRLTVGLELRASWSGQAFSIPQRRSRLNRYGLPLELEADSYSVGAQAMLDYKLSDNWRVIAVASHDQIVDAGKNVLQFQSRSVPVVSVLLTRRFRVF